MTTTPSIPTGEGLHEHEDRLARFEQLWEQGTPPRIEDWLPADLPGRPGLLTELVKIDLEYRWRLAGPAGGASATPRASEDSFPGRPRLEDYRERFPELGSAEGLALDLVGEEYRVRQWWGDRPAHAEYRRRFPGRGTELDDLLARIDAELAAEGRPPLPGLEDYEILEELGRGGSGVVCKARQRSLDRLVALKLLSLHGPAGAPDRARFLTEARLAAGLVHPNIVQIHEVGEQDGRPYLCLEYVPGGSLAARLAGTPLPPLEAAALVQTLARAIHHAHQRGVVHRDLKPANVLLQMTNDQTPRTYTQGPSPLVIGYWDLVIPKITDFGLAKRLDDAAGPTQTGAVLGTPSYMAPEQAGGKSKEVGPAADVYALGAILYETLTGRPPFRGATVLETLEQVKGQEPVPPRRLQPVVPRDLETICLRCLEKEPARRYRTALDLAEDLRRFAAGEPIRARPVGAWERAAKWARRRPALAALVAVSVAAALALLLGGWWSNAGLRAALARAQRNQERAEDNLEQAFAAVDRMLTRVAEEKLYDAPEMDEVRRQLLADAVAVCQGLLGQEGEADERVQREVARARWRLGKIHHELGQSADAGEDYRLARIGQEELLARFPEDPGRRDDLARTCDDQSRLLAAVGRKADAEAAARRAAELWEGLASQGPEYRTRLAGLYLNLGGLLRETGRTAEGESFLTRAVDLRAELTRENPGESRYARDLAIAHYCLGNLYAEKGPAAEAEKAYRAALVVWEPVANASPGRPDYQEARAAAYQNLGMVLIPNAARRSEADECFNRALAIRENLVRDHPRVVALRNNLAAALYGRANLLNRSGRSGEAVKALQKAVEIREDLIREQPAALHFRTELAETCEVLAHTCGLMGRLQESRRAFDRALELLEPLARDHPESTSFALALGSACNNRADVLRCHNRPAEALPWHDRAVNTLEALLARDPTSATAKAFAGAAHGGRACSRGALGQHAEAAEDWSRLIDLTEEGPRRNGYRVFWATTRARQGDHAAALAEVDALAARPNLAADTLYNLACVASLASAAAGRDARLSAPQRADLAERCACRALDLLRQAHDAGAFATSAMRDHLRKDDDLRPLRSREDFRRFQEELLRPAASPPNP